MQRTMSIPENKSREGKFGKIRQFIDFLWSWSSWHNRKHTWAQLSSWGGGNIYSLLCPHDFPLHPVGVRWTHCKEHDPSKKHFARVEKKHQMIDTVGSVFRFRRSPSFEFNSHKKGSTINFKSFGFNLLCHKPLGFPIHCKSQLTYQFRETGCSERLL